MEAIKLSEKLDSVNDLWKLRVIAELNGQHVKLSKVHGEFVWHEHKNEDKLFFIIKGKLKMMFRDRSVDLNAGEMMVVPKGVEHKPVAEKEVWMMLFEAENVKHTGDSVSHLIVEGCEKF